MLICFFIVLYDQAFCRWSPCRSHFLIHGLDSLFYFVFAEQFKKVLLLTPSIWNLFCFTFSQCAKISNTLEISLLCLPKSPQLFIFLLSLSYFDFAYVEMVKFGQVSLLIISDFSLLFSFRKASLFKYLIYTYIFIFFPLSPLPPLCLPLGFASRWLPLYRTTKLVENCFSLLGACSARKPWDRDWDGFLYTTTLFPSFIKKKKSQNNNKNSSMSSFSIHIHKLDNS